jgi:hypothetical protein
MDILVRRTTIWAFAAFFGCISLLGPGWHCVFGHHFHGAHSCAHSIAEAAAIGRRSGCCVSEHSASQATHTTDAANPTGEPAITHLANPGHHCPLCQFFGTAQWSPSLAPTELVLIAAELLIPAASARDREAPRLYLSRAPPRALAHR